MLPDAPSHRILIVSDAWHPQVNGVVRTLTTVVAELRAMGHVVDVIGPDRFRTVPCPTYPDISLSLFPRRRLVRMIEEFQPDALHIATEGPLGLAARSWAHAHRDFVSPPRFTPDSRNICKRARAFRCGRSTPGCAAFTMPAPARWSPPDRLQDELTSRGFSQIRPWSRGVDLDLFKPEPREKWDLPRPVFIYVGRVAVEKNIGAFLDLDLPGSKVVVGGGPQLAALRREYPAVTFTGPRYGEELGSRLRRRRRVRVPKPDRHVRPGDPGVAGLRHAGRGVPGDRSQGRADRRARLCRCGQRRFAPGRAGRAARPIVRPAGPMPNDTPGAPARSCSCRI